VSNLKNGANFICVWNVFCCNSKQQMGFHHVMLTWHFGEEPVERTMHLSNSINAYYGY